TSAVSAKQEGGSFYLKTCFWHERGRRLRETAGLWAQTAVNGQSLPPAPFLLFQPPLLTVPRDLISALFCRYLTSVSVRVRGCGGAATECEPVTTGERFKGLFIEIDPSGLLG
ncbi:unnamed protein product, partial [Pleuronectes platessa]